MRRGPVRVGGGSKGSEGGVLVREANRGSEGHERAVECIAFVYVPAVRVGIFAWSPVCVGESNNGVKGEAE